MYFYLAFFANRVQSEKHLGGVQMSGVRWFWSHPHCTTKRLPSPSPQVLMLHHYRFFILQLLLFQEAAFGSTTCRFLPWEYN